MSIIITIVCLFSLFSVSLVCFEMFAHLNEKKLIKKQLTSIDQSLNDIEYEMMQYLKYKRISNN